MNISNIHLILFSIISISITRTARPFWSSFWEADSDWYILLKLITDGFGSFPKLEGIFLEVPIIKDYSILGSILGFLILRNYWASGV